MVKPVHCVAKWSTLPLWRILARPDTHTELEPPVPVLASRLEVRERAQYRFASDLTWQIASQNDYADVCLLIAKDSEAGDRT